MGRENDNLIMIGMPASGKSTVGVILAKILGMAFMDTDILIQQRAGARLNEIIESRGIDGFLKLEEQVLLDIHCNHTIIATGGSAVYSDMAMKHLADGSRVIYLQVRLDDLTKRLQDIKERGVVLRAGESLEQMYEHRSALYEQYADITVSEESASIEDTVRAVLDAL